MAKKERTLTAQLSIDLGTVAQCLRMMERLVDALPDENQRRPLKHIIELEAKPALERAQDHCATIAVTAGTI